MTDPSTEQQLPPRAPIYACLRPEDIQGDPATKPEATEVLRETYHVFRDVAQERYRQHVKWGGYAHDDEHGPNDWVAYITEHAGQARSEAERSCYDAHRQELVKVAALAVAAIEALDRRYGDDA